MSAKEGRWLRDGVYRVRASKDSDDVHCYLYSEGRFTLDQVLSYLAEVAPVRSRDITLSPGVILWTEKANDDELTRWAAIDAAAVERSEKWQRETYERLREKFDPAPSPAEDTESPAVGGPKEDDDDHA